MTTSRPSRLNDVTVLVPTLGTPLLEECVESILAGNAWPSLLVVVDQGDNPGVERLLKNAQSRGLTTEHIKLPRRSIPVAMNRGTERVRTGLVAVTHDDCRVAENWLGKMTSCMRENPGRIVTGRVDPESDKEVPSVNSSRRPAIYKRPSLKGDVLFPNNMGYSLDVFHRIGAFDESPLFAAAGEDADWGYRALRTGVPIVYEPEVVVTHGYRRDSKERAATYRTYARALGAFYGKYLRQGDCFIAVRTLKTLLVSPWLWLSGLLAGNHDRAAHGRAFCAGLLPGIIAGLGQGERR